MIKDIPTIPTIQPTSPEAYQLMHEGMLAFSEATTQGMCMDVPYMQETQKKLKTKIKVSKKKFLKSGMGKLWKKSYLRPNLNSPDQLGDILYNKLKIKSTKKTKKGNNSTDNEVLEKASEDVPGLVHLLRYKKLDKILGTYLNNFIKETVQGVMHPGFSLNIPVTFRSSSQNPNFQNIPNRDKESKKICRSAIIPRKGFQLIEADFSGIEVGISCCYHKDKKMINYVKYPEKNNMHTDMAIQIFMLDQFQKEGGEKLLRFAAKNGFVFPQFYGDYYGNNAVTLTSLTGLPPDGRFSNSCGVKLMSGDTLGKHLRNKGITSYDSFVNHVKEVEDDFWKNRFKGYDLWKKRNVKNYYKNGFVHTLTGFTCSGLLSDNDINNYPIQGSAFHCNLKCFIKLGQEIKQRGLKSRLIGQIHDSMVIDAHPNELKTLMSLIKWIACEWLLDEWKWINVPMEIEAGIFGVNANWATESYTEVLRA